MQNITDALPDEITIDDVKSILDQAKEEMVCYKCAMLEVETKFKVLDERFSIQTERNPIESIKCRIKSPESILEKLRRKKLPPSFSSLRALNDIAGVRVICSFVEDIYMLADCLIRQDDVVLIQKRDYIKSPKKNGYRSLHLIIEIPIFLHDEKRNMRVEVQLRTIAMETWANLEHKLCYKKQLDAATQAAISQKLLSCAAICTTLDTQMQEIKHTVEECAPPEKQRFLPTRELDYIASPK